MSKRWYVIHAYSGFEGQVKRSLEERIKRAGLEDLFGPVLVPTEEVVEIRNGQQRKSERKFFPGYVLVNMDLTDETWHLVKSVPKVMGFIGGTGDRPAPIPDKQADAILQRVQEGVEKPRPKVLYEPGEIVRVVDGPFTDFNGIVEEVDYDKNRVKVSVLDLRPLDAGRSRIRPGREGLMRCTCRPRPADRAYPGPGAGQIFGEPGSLAPGAGTHQECTRGKKDQCLH